MGMYYMEDELKSSNRSYIVASKWQLGWFRDKGNKWINHLANYITLSNNPRRVKP